MLVFIVKIAGVVFKSRESVRLVVCRMYATVMNKVLRSSYARGVQSRLCKPTFYRFERACSFVRVVGGSGYIEGCGYLLLVVLDVLLAQVRS